MRLKNYSLCTFTGRSVIPLIKLEERYCFFPVTSMYENLFNISSQSIIAKLNESIDAAEGLRLCMRVSWTIDKRSASERTKVAKML